MGGPRTGSLVGAIGAGATAAWHLHRRHRPDPHHARVDPGDRGADERAEQVWAGVVELLAPELHQLAVR